MASSYKDSCILRRIDLTVASLGIETMGGQMAFILPKYSSIPCRVFKIFTTSEDNQTKLELRVCEGESPTAAENEVLGRFELNGIHPAPRGTKQVKVYFDVDAFGALTVSARDDISGAEGRIVCPDYLDRVLDRDLRKENLLSKDSGPRRLCHQHSLVGSLPVLYHNQDAAAKPSVRSVCELD